MNEYGIRLTRPIPSADRRRFAELLGPKLKLEPERVEKLLGKNGNLIKGAGRERIEGMAAIFESCGVSVNVVELEPESSKSTSIRAPVAAVVREATRTIPPKNATSVKQTSVKATNVRASSVLPEPTGGSSILPPASPTVAESLAALRARVAKQTGTVNPTQAASTAILETTDSGLARPEHLTSVDLTPLGTNEQPHLMRTNEAYSTSAKSSEWHNQTLRRSGGWLSLRWKLIGLTVLPLLAVSGAWLFSIFTKQANDARTLLVQGAIETASVFGDSLADNLNALPENTQARANTLVQSKLLPLKFVLVTDAKGQPVIAAERNTPENPAPDANTIEGWRGRNPEASATMTSMVPQTVNAMGGDVDPSPSAENPFAQPVGTASGTVILAAHPLPGKAGATILGLDADAMQARVMESALSSIVQLAAVLLGTGLLAWAFANGLIRRLVGLSEAANRVSMGAMSEVIESDGKDEISDLAESVERMRASLETAMTKL